MRLFLVVFLLPLLACNTTDAPAPPAMPPLSSVPLEPRPFEISDAEGYYFSDGRLTEEQREDAAPVVREMLVELPPVHLTTVVQSGLNLPAGAYLLLISPEGITLSAGEEQGLLRGAEALRQLIESRPPSERGVFLPAGTIVDQPM